MDSINFNLYSKYYDLLYKDKDYVKESLYINENIKIYNPSTKSILELGCGTGSFGINFIKMGYDVVGIDKSEYMVEIANKCGLRAYKKDICDFNLEFKFDTVVALFHVISYISTNLYLISVFNHVRNHLSENGIFIFDVWYLPAVLFQEPEKRIKTMENEEFLIKRFANPIIDYNKNLVHVNYDLLIKNKINNSWSELSEVHTMRYFSIPEIELLASKCGFNILKCEEFYTRDEPSCSTWGLCFILQKI